MDKRKINIATVKQLLDARYTVKHPKVHAIAIKGFNLFIEQDDNADFTYYIKNTKDFTTTKLDDVDEDVLNNCIIPDLSQLFTENFYLCQATAMEECLDCKGIVEASELEVGDL